MAHESDKGIDRPSALARLWRWPTNTLGPTVVAGVAVGAVLACIGLAWALGTRVSGIYVALVAVGTIAAGFASVVLYVMYHPPAAPSVVARVIAEPAGSAVQHRAPVPRLGWAAWAELLPSQDPFGERDPTMVNLKVQGPEEDGFRMFRCYVFDPADAETVSNPEFEEENSARHYSELIWPLGVVPGPPDPLLPGEYRVEWRAREWPERWIYLTGTEFRVMANGEFRVGGGVPGPGPVPWVPPSS